MGLYFLYPAKLLCGYVICCPCRACYTAYRRRLRRITNKDWLCILPQSKRLLLVLFLPLYHPLCITHPTRCLLSLTAGVVRFELTTVRLTVGYSAIELHAIKYQNELSQVVLHSLLCVVLLFYIV